RLPCASSSLVASVLASSRTSGRVSHITGSVWRAPYSCVGRRTEKALTVPSAKLTLTVTVTDEAPAGRFAAGARARRMLPPPPAFVLIVFEPEMGPAPLLSARLSQVALAKSAAGQENVTPTIGELLRLVTLKISVPALSLFGSSANTPDTFMSWDDAPEKLISPVK